MEKAQTLWNGITMKTGGAFPLSTDSMCLADFVPLAAGCRAVDLGSGCGTLGLLLCGRRKDCSAVGVELSLQAHQAALENIRANRLEERLSSVHGDIRNIHSLLPAGQFDLAVSNPPYFPPGAGLRAEGKHRALAREAGGCPLEALFSAAAWLLHSGGRFCLIHRTERLADLFCAGRAAGLEPKRLRLIRHRPDSDANLALLEFRRDGGSGLKLLPDLVLYDEKNDPSPDFRRIYHL